MLEGVCQSLNDLKDGFGVKSLERDAEILVNQRKILKDLGKEERSGLKVVSILKAKRAELQSALAAKIERDWRELICVNADGVDLIHDDQFPNRLKDLVAAAKYLQTFSALVENLAVSIFHHIILPLATGKATCQIVSGGKLSVQSINQATDSGPALPTATRLMEIRNIFIFFQQNVFLMDSDSNRELAVAFGSKINADFVNAVRRNCIEESLPVDFGEFEATKADIMKRLGELKAILLQLNWISSSDSSWDFDIVGLDAMYASKCGTELLMLTRRLLTSEKDFLIQEIIPQSPSQAGDTEEDFSLFQLQEMSIR